MTEIQGDYLVTNDVDVAWAFHDLVGYPDLAVVGAVEWSYDRDKVREALKPVEGQAVR